jgi:hypothetical protein
MIDDILKNRKDVVEYDSTVMISQDLIDSLLRRAWKVTPSKNNFMPYTIHVLGPEHKDYKNNLYLNCLSNEGYRDGVDSTDRYRNQGNLPQYSNILNCSYAFIFTQRLEDQPNKFQKNAISRGRNFEAVNESTLGSIYSGTSLEVGMFADAFSALCLENNIDVSYTLCFHKNLEHWGNLPFVKRDPLLIMTAGKGKTYRYDRAVKNGRDHLNHRPEYERIVNFVDSDVN